MNFWCVIADEEVGPAGVLVGGEDEVVVVGDEVVAIGEEVDAVSMLFGGLEPAGHHRDGGMDPAGHHLPSRPAVGVGNQPRPVASLIVPSR